MPAVDCLMAAAVPFSTITMATLGVVLRLVSIATTQRELRTVWLGNMTIQHAAVQPDHSTLPPLRHIAYRALTKKPSLRGLSSLS